jgi:molybdate transport system ATP-binding protein
VTGRGETRAGSGAWQASPGERQAGSADATDRWGHGEQPLIVHGRVVRGQFAVAVDLSVPPGRTVVLLGPNGAGKTTLLRAVAGLTPLAEGRISLGARVLDDPAAGVLVPPERRRVAVVFQDYRLFAHLDVRDNVAFGPRRRGMRRAAARELAEQWLARFDLEPLARRRPTQLSGGQQQRVALARALATDPEVLELDEPLAALDARTRHQVRTELRSVLARVAAPTLLVTHDPLDALTLADEVVVLEGGRVVQSGTPAEVARHPRTDYVARLVGLNLYHGRRAGSRIDLAEGGSLMVPAPLRPAPTGAPGLESDQADQPDQQDVLVAVPPSAVSVHLHRPDPTSVRNTWPGRVADVQLLGDRVRLQVVGPPDALVDVTPAAVTDLALDVGRPVWLAVKALEVEVYSTASAAPDDSVTPR